MMPNPAQEKNKGGSRLPVSTSVLPAWIVMVIGALGYRHLLWHGSIIVRLNC